MEETVYGLLVNDNTGCVHYHSSLDIIAIKCKCCRRYYSCISCHDHLEDHPFRCWNKNEFSEKAVFCGSCKNTLSINEYLSCNSLWIHCGGKFNPGCKDHWDCYFQYNATAILHVKQRSAS